MTSTQAILGSSPRVWGQGLTKHICKKRLRIIPTRMGTSDYSAATNTGDWDHPHAYGDKLKIGAKIGISGGSSPRVWGQETIIQISQKGCRIIPTRMGTRTLKNNLSCCAWDHPHAYGDKLCLNYVVNYAMGSSPRVWGQGVVIGINAKGDRIIPTRMGTS